MTLQTIALILLLTRIASLTLVLMVIIKQIQLFKRTIDLNLSTFRVVMFLLAFVFLLSNIFPIYIDVLYAFNIPVDNEKLVLTIYASSNAMSALSGSILLWKVYKIAGKQIEEEASTRQGEK